MNAQACEHLGLPLVRSAYAAKSQLAAVDQGQDHVAALDHRGRGQDLARRHVEAAVARQPVQRAVHRVRDETHEHVRFYALLDLVKHGSNRQVLLQRAESGLGIVELHVHVPQLLFGLAGQVRAQKVRALGMSHVRRLGHVLAPGQRQGRAVTLDGDVVRPCHA